MIGLFDPAFVYAANGGTPVIPGSISLVAASGQYLSTTSTVSDNSRGSFTWVVRCNLTPNGSFQSLMYLLDGVVTLVEILVFPDNAIQFAINNTFNASKPMTFGSWVTVIAEHDAVGGTMRLSLNNGTASSGSTAAPSLNGSALTLGSRDFASLPCNGLFNFAGVLNRTLTNAERNELSAGDTDYAHLSAGLQSAAIWWMDFDSLAALLTNSVGSEVWSNPNSATWSSMAG